MSRGRRIDRKAVVHIHSGILLSHQKVYTWIRSNEVDETAACYTEWSKSERETPIQYINIYMEFRKKVMTTLYARQQKRHRCKKQTSGLCGRGRGWDDLGEWHWNMYTIMKERVFLSMFSRHSPMMRQNALFVNDQRKNKKLSERKWLTWAVWCRALRTA